MRLFRILCIFFALTQQSLPVNSQAQLPDAPPNDLIVAAANAFQEYGGTTIDTLVNSGPQVPKNLVFAKTYDAPGNADSYNPSRGKYPNEHLEALVRSSSFVGFAIPLKRWTYPTVGNKFAFSIYLVRVTSILVPGPDALYTGQTIYVVRAGGPVTYKGHTIRALDPEFRLFHLNEEYLFFGERLSPQEYKVNSEESLLIKNDQVIESSTHVKHPQLFSRQTRTTLFSEVMAAEYEVSRSPKGARFAKAAQSAKDVR